MSFREIYKKGLDFVRLSGGKSTWGLEIGDSGLKAVKASARDRELYIEAIDRIDYSSIEHEITSKKPDLIEGAVNIFKERNLISKSDKIIFSLSDKMILSRFFSLPPIKKSRIAEALRYELRKQVPFEPDEIIWDYQQFEGDRVTDSSVKIGLFATKKENIYLLRRVLLPSQIISWRHLGIILQISMQLHQNRANVTLVLLLV